MAQNSGEAQKMPFWSIHSGNLRNAKTTPSLPVTLGEISNCPSWCTEKLKMTPKHTKGVIYTNTNTYWVILKPFKHPEVLKRAYFAPQKSWIGYLHVLPLCPTWKLWTYEYYELISSKIEFIRFSFKKRSRDSFVESQIILIVILVSNKKLLREQRFYFSVRIMKESINLKLYFF